MGRPPKTDRAAVGSETLTLRLTKADRAMLDGLVAAKSAELEENGLDVTAAAYVRGLIRREARHLIDADTGRFGVSQSREARAVAAHATDLAVRKAVAADRKVTAPTCICTVTNRERQENRACPVHFPARASKPAAPTAERRQHPRPDDKKVRALLDRVLAKGIVPAKEIARLIGVNPSQLSRWKGGGVLADSRLDNLERTLESLLQPSLPSVAK